MSNADIVVPVASARLSIIQHLPSGSFLTRYFVSSLVSFTIVVHGPQLSVLYGGVVAFMALQVSVGRTVLTLWLWN